MPDREKVTEALELCAIRKPGEYDCHKCPYETRIDGDGCEVNVMLDAVNLLKWQKPLTPIMTADCRGIIYNCGACGALIATVTDTVSANYVRKSIRFCQRCGKAVKWDA